LNNTDSQRVGEATSHTTATLLLVAITILLAVLVLLMFRMPALDWDNPPSFLEIQAIYSTNEHGMLNYDSRVLLCHKGTNSLENDQLRPVFYRNGFVVPCQISTMNGHRFIPTVHIGVQTMSGLGCSGETWAPGEKILIDFTDGTFRPGDRVRMDVIDKPTGSVVSRHSYTA
jgi:hypothetical protein